MANTSSFKITPRSGLTEAIEFSFRGLHLYYRPKPVIDRSLGFGTIAANNWTVRDGLGSDAKVVARAQGLHILAGNWHNSFSLVFEDGRFKGSTLEVMGIVLEADEWAIVGGTGQFAMATGVIQNRHHRSIPGEEGGIIELTIQGFCLLLNGSSIFPTKIRTFGGNGGSVRDIMEPPRRLESVTICSAQVIDAILFSYVDHAGQKHVAGPWGGPHGNPNMIQLASSEFVNEVSGTFGEFRGLTVVTSLKLTTNIKSYGPFGTEMGTPFSAPAQAGNAITGFFACSGEYLDAIGVYVHPL